MSVVVIQNSWTEEDDIELIEYIQSAYPSQYKVMNEMEILSSSPDEMIGLFCDTDVVQRLLQTRYKAPDTYSKSFETLYNRKISKLSFAACYDHPKPFFIKPYDNNKAFYARIIERVSQLDSLKEELNDDDYVYVCDVVKFMNEYRVFMGPDKVYGVVNSSKFVLPSNDAPEYHIEPPSEFIHGLIEQNKEGYCVVDVGMLQNGTWAVVEVNPPFALSSYDWPISEYVTYCLDAWAHINSH